MRSERLLTGSILAAIGASLCCIGPFLEVLTGVGALSVFSRFDAARPYLLVLSIALLSAGLYWAWRKWQAGCAPGGNCQAKPAKTRLVLVIPILAVAAAAAFPYYSSGWLGGASRRLASEATQAGRFTTVRFRISGMTCESCANGMAASFRNLPSIKDAVVEYPSGNTSVTYDPAKVSADQLAALVREAGYEFRR